MKSNSSLLKLSISLALLAATTSGEEAKKTDVPSGANEPVKMEPVHVSATFVSIKMRPYYHDSPSGPTIARLLIEDVRKNSPAERAGLAPGMELFAIQGTAVRGLAVYELEKLIQQPVIGDVLTLKVAPASASVRDGAEPRFTQDIRIPQQRSAPPPPLTISITIAPPPPPTISITIAPPPTGAKKKPASEQK